MNDKVWDDACREPPKQQAMTESLQEIERLMEHACMCGRGVCKSCDNLRSAITRVVQESEKQVEIVKSLHRETREELYAKELLVAERDAWKRAATYWYLLRPGRRGTDDNVLKIPGEAFDVALQSAALGEQPKGPKP